MRWVGRLLRREYYHSIVMGLVDGILTALLLATGRLLGRGEPVNLSLAIRVAIGALATSGFIFYIGRYAGLRGRLVRAERELNLVRRGRLATTQLGRAVLLEAISDAVISGTFSFAGALLPLVLAVALPANPLISIVIPIALLGMMGFVLGKAVSGSSVLWAICLLFGGGVIAILGYALRLV